MTLNAYIHVAQEMVFGTRLKSARNPVHSSVIYSVLPSNENPSGKSFYFDEISATFTSAIYTSAPSCQNQDQIFYFIKPVFTMSAIVVRISN